MRKVGYLVFIIYTLFLSSCSLIENSDLVYEPSFALPLINSNLTVQSLLNTSENFEVQVNSDQTITIIYKSELANQEIGDILQPISSVGEIPILDSVSFFPLQTGPHFSITNAVFKGDEMRFRYTHTKPEDVAINMKIPELTKGGVPFEQDYILEYQGETPFTAFTESVELKGYEYSSPESSLTFIYNARNAFGERIVLDFAAMSFNLLDFSYGEGIFGKQELPLLGQDIQVGIFNSWKSGLLEFKDPKITFSINHSYGFPVALRINNMELTSIENVKKQLEGTSVGKVQILNFPSSSEVGFIKNTTFELNNSNSNIAQLFNEKVKNISYNVDAIINPEGTENTMGFVLDDSFFSLEVAAEIPLSQRIDNLVLRDTIPLESNLPEEIKSAEFKVITANSYPASIDLKIIFLDNNNNELFSLFNNENLIIEAAELNNEGNTLPGEEKTRFIDLNANDTEKLRNAKKMVVEPVFNSKIDEFVNFYENQSLELRVGLIVNL